MVEGRVGLNKSLVEYVKQHGYVESAQMLLSEMDRGVSSGGVGVGSKDSVSYSDGYGRLRGWLLNSLDDFRDELWPVLWVVYLHSYIRLVRGGDMLGAVSFRNKFKGDHDMNHFDEVLELCSISDASQLDGVGLVKRVEGGRFQIGVCEYACELLLSFLMENELLLLLSLVNEKVEFVVGADVSRRRVSCLGELVSGVVEVDAGSSMLGDCRLNRDHSVKWFVPLVFKGLVNGTTGALAVAKTHPKVPSEYMSGVDAGVDISVQEAEEKAKNDAEKALENALPTKPIAARMTKLDRHNLEQLKAKETAEAMKNSATAATKLHEAKKKSKTNHIAPKEAHPDTEKMAYLRDIKRVILEQLKLRMVEPGDMVDITIAEKSQARAKEMQSVVGTQLSSVSEDNVVWPSIALQTFFNTHDSMVCVDASSDLALFVSGFDDSVARLWSYGSGKTDPECEELVGHAGPIYGCSISPDKESLLTCSEDGSVRLWMYFPELIVEAGAGATTTEEEKKKHKKKRKRHARKKKQQGQWRNVFAFRCRPLTPIWDVKFSPAGYYFCTGSYDGIVRLWNVEQAEPLRLYSGHLADVDSLCWHPNCLYIASGSTDKTIRVWNVPSGECVRLLCGHVGGVNAIEFCSSGRYLVSGGQDKLVIVWDFSTGQRVSILTGHSGPVWSISVSPDYRFIATGSGDGSVRVWDTYTIWGKGSLAYHLAIRQPHDDDSQNKPIHIPKKLKETPKCRSFPTKYTPVHYVKFHNERMLLASGSFALPVMR